MALTPGVRSEETGMPRDGSGHAQRRFTGPTRCRVEGGTAR